MPLLSCKTVCGSSTVSCCDFALTQAAAKGFGAFEVPCYSIHKLFETFVLFKIEHDMEIIATSFVLKSFVPLLWT